jgi:dynein heavy chain
MADARYKYVSKLVTQAFGLPGSSVVDSAMSGNDLVAKFFNGEGPPKLIFYYQPQTSTVPTVFLTTGDAEALTGKCAFFVRLTDKAVNAGSVDTDLNFMTMSGGDKIVPTLKGLTETLFQPAIQANMFGFAKQMADDDKNSLIKSNEMLVTKLDTALQNLATAINLPVIEGKDLAENKPSALHVAASNPDLIVKYEEILLEWCSLTEGVLNDPENQPTEDQDKVGPRTELEWWRARMGKLNSIIQQLRGEECRIILGVLTIAKVRTLKRWKGGSRGRCRSSRSTRR